MNGQIDWQLISDIFEGIADDLGTFRNLSQEEYERARLSWLTYGLVKSEFVRPFEEGNPQIPPDGVQQQRWHMLAALALGSARSEGFAVLLPGHIQRHILSQRPDAEIIRNAISARYIDDEFLISWARINQLRGVQVALKPHALDLLQKKIEGARAQSREIQQHWYARWLKKNAASLSPNDREKAAPTLVGVCDDIVKGKLRPWGPYPVRWYRNLLNKVCTHLVDNFYKLGEPRLLELLVHPIITDNIVPPLSRDGFEARTPRGGG